MTRYGIATFWRILVIFVLLGSAACTNRKVVLPYNEPPLDLQIPVSSVRVESFSGGDSRYSGPFRDTLVALLAKEGTIQIRTTTAESVLSGNVEIGRINKNTYSEAYKTKEKINDEKVEVTKYNYFYRKTLSASVTYQLKKNNQIICGNTYQTQFDTTWKADSAQAAKAEALSDHKVINQSLTNLAMDIVRGISPHQTAVQFNLQLGSIITPNEGLKAGVEYYQKGLFAQAESYWQQVLKNETDPKLKAAAHFNLGVNQFREKHFAQAFNFFRNADQLDPTNQDYMSAISLTELTQLYEDQVRKLKSKTGVAFRLLVNAQPSKSRVRIMNIVEKYQPGISLAPGKFKIQVDHPGYFPETRLVTINHKDQFIDIVLKKRQ